MNDSNRVSIRLFLGFSLIVFGMTTSGSSFAGNPSALIKNNLDGSQTLIGHVPLEVKNSTATFQHHADSSQIIAAKIILPLDNQTQLSSFLKGLYDPTSPNFHHFITPVQFAQQYSSSALNAQFVQEFLNKQGITSNGPSVSSFVLNVKGPVSSFEQAFGLHINYYQKADGTLFFAADADPTIPATLSDKILAIGGLDNLAKYQPHSHKASVKNLSNALIVNGLTDKQSSKSITGTGPGGFLAPNDVKLAYNMNTVPSNGAGQNLALFELDGFTPSDITAYDQQFGLSGVPTPTVLIDGFNGVPDYNAGAGEVTLDIELMTAFAPGASNIFVYEAPNTYPSWVDEWSQIASDNKAKVISCSWGDPENDSPTITFDNQIYQQMAAQGQAVFIAAGDSGAYDDAFEENDALVVGEPADQPFATAVGISVLSTNPDGSYNSEKASTQGGGGISVALPIPFYQTLAASQANAAAKVSTTMRNVPDVALTADDNTSYSFYIDGSWGGWWGSSLSSPIWASFMACVNQGLGQNAPLGFVNPLLYQLAQNANSYANDFHDITTGNNGDLKGIPGREIGNGYSAEPGFDDATGLGSFNGLNLYNDLLTQVNAAAIQPPSTPVGLQATAGISQVTVSWSLSATATSYDVQRSTVNGGPYNTIATTGTFNNYYIDNSVNNGTTYYYVVSAINSKGQSANSTQATATLTLTIPAQPVGLSASAGNAQVTLMWNSSPGATTYNIKKSTNTGGPYTTFAFLVTSRALVTFVDNSVANGVTYYYVVSAVNSKGESPNSLEVNGMPMLPSAVPTGLSATTGDGWVALTWNVSSRAASYNVKRATARLGPYTIIGNATTNTQYPVPNLYDTNVTNGTTYYYTVSAVNINGAESSNSKPIKATPQFLPPSPPVGIQITTLTNNFVQLTWVANPVYSYGLSISYNVKRSTVSGGPYTLQSGYFWGNKNFEEGSLTTGTTYYYVVSVVNSAGEGPNSAEVKVTPMPLPVAPTNLTAIAGNTQVTLSWAASLGAISYQVERFINPNSIYLFPSIAGTSYNDNNYLDNGTTYTYCVQAKNANGELSPCSTKVSATTQAPIAAPIAPPTPFSAVVGNGQVTLNWGNRPRATSYIVERSQVSAGPYTTISTTTGRFSTSYTDTAVANGTTYYYVVLASNSFGNGPASAVVGATPNTLPATPAVLRASKETGYVSLSWPPSQGATSYIIQRSTVSGGHYQTIASTVTDSYNDNTVINGKTYYYVVMAVNAAGNSLPSAQAPVLYLVPPSAPVGLKASSGNGQVILTWNAAKTATSYNVQRAIVNGGPYTSIGNSVANTYTDASVSNGTIYYYVVAASNATGQGSNSAQVTAKPEMPTLTGTPNPCVSLNGSPCTVTINWQSGGLTQVWVKMDANNPQLFSCGIGGSQKATWIQPGHAYTFILYNATSCAASGQTGHVLSSILITGKTNVELTGTPNPCPAKVGSLCTATIHWQSDNLSEVWVQMDRKAPQLFSCGSYGTQQAPWIQPGHAYTFMLYNATSCTTGGQSGAGIQSVTIRGI